MAFDFLDKTPAKVAEGMLFVERQGLLVLSLLGIGKREESERDAK